MPAIPAATQTALPPLRIDPSRPEEIVREEHDNALKWAKDELRSYLEEGWGPFQKAKPRERLTSYLLYTLENDLPLVLNEAYMDNRENGAAAFGLLAEEMWQDYTEQKQAALQEAAMMLDQGMPAPEMPEDPPWKFWPMLLTQTPPFVWRWFERDFRSLYNEFFGRE